MVSEEPQPSLHARHHSGAFVAWLIPWWDLVIMGGRACGALNGLLIGMRIRSNWDKVDQVIF